MSSKTKYVIACKTCGIIAGTEKEYADYCICEKCNSYMINLDKNTDDWFLAEKTDRKNLFNSNGFPEKTKDYVLKTRWNILRIILWGSLFNGITNTLFRLGAIPAMILMGVAYGLATLIINAIYTCEKGYRVDYNAMKLGKKQSGSADIVSEVTHENVKNDEAEKVETQEDSFHEKSEENKSESNETNAQPKSSQRDVKQKNNTNWILLISICALSIFLNVVMLAINHSVKVELTTAEQSITSMQNDANDLKTKYYSLMEENSKNGEKADYLDSEIAFVGSDNTYYHSYDCPLIQNKERRVYTRDDAKAKGFKECTRCVGAWTAEDLVKSYTESNYEY